MPRTARATPGGHVFHVLNRGNGRQTVFHEPRDYEAFARLMVQAGERAPVGIMAWCLMPNHFHLLLRPPGDADLARWMQWLMTVHVRRHHARHGTGGHLWQGRFKSFPVQDDAHLLTVARYVESNPRRAGLVARAEDWRWSSLPVRLGRDGVGPDRAALEAALELPSGWADWVNGTVPEGEASRLGRCIAKGTPFGGLAWVEETARRLGLGHSLRSRGRPRRTPPH